MYLSPKALSDSQGRWRSLGLRPCTYSHTNSPTKPNITVDELKAIKELREDQSRVVFTVDKGVAMVIMDKKEYTDKAIGLLSDTNTYRTIPKDPTNKLIGILKDIKQTDGLKDSTYCKMCHTSAVPQKLYDLP